MGKLITGKIDVTKIVKSLLYEGKKGTYLDLIIWQNDKPDQFGNDFSIQQRTGKDEPKIYIGEAKFFVKKEDNPLPDKQGEYQGKKEIKSMSNIKDLPGAEDSEMPF